MLKPISEIAPHLSFGKSKTTQLLKDMRKKGIVIVEGWWLKEAVGRSAAPLHKHWIAPFLAVRETPEYDIFSTANF